VTDGCQATEFTSRGVNCGNFSLCMSFAEKAGRCATQEAGNGEETPQEESEQPSSGTMNSATETASAVSSGVANIITNTGNAVGEGTMGAIHASEQLANGLVSASGEGASAVAKAGTELGDSTAVAGVSTINNVAATGSGLIGGLTTPTLFQTQSKLSKWGRRQQQSRAGPSKSESRARAFLSSRLQNLDIQSSQPDHVEETANVQIGASRHIPASTAHDHVAPPVSHATSTIPHPRARSSTKWTAKSNQIAPSMKAMSDGNLQLKKDVSTSPKVHIEDWKTKNLKKKQEILAGAHHNKIPEVSEDKPHLETPASRSGTTLSESKTSTNEIPNRRSTDWVKHNAEVRQRFANRKR